MKSELVKPIHLARRAAVYIRQSTTHQVVNNQGKPALAIRASAASQRTRVARG